MLFTVAPIFCRAICGVGEGFLVVIFVGGHSEECGAGMVDCSSRDNSTCAKGRGAPAARDRLFVLERRAQKRMMSEAAGEEGKERVVESVRSRGAAREGGRIRWNEGREELL